MSDHWDEADSESLYRDDEDEVCECCGGMGCEECQPISTETQKALDWYADWSGRIQRAWEEYSRAANGMEREETVKTCFDKYAHLVRQAAKAAGGNRE